MMEKFSGNMDKGFTPEESEKLRLAKRQFLVISSSDREKIISSYHEMLAKDETPERLKLMLKDFLDWAEYQNDLANGEVKS